MHEELDVVLGEALSHLQDRSESLQAALEVLAKLESVVEVSSELFILIENKLDELHMTGSDYDVEAAQCTFEACLRGLGLPILGKLMREFG